MSGADIFVSKRLFSGVTTGFFLFVEVDFQRPSRSYCFYPDSKTVRIVASSRDFSAASSQPPSFVQKLLPLSVTSALLLYLTRGDPVAYPALRIGDFLG